jgi:peptide/nickel transport system ATP-binding protein
MPDLRTQTTSPVLSVAGLTVTIGGVPVVDRVSFALGAGEILALVGESGCGKSLTALALTQLLPSAARFDAGSVQLEGQELTHLTEAQIRRLRGRRISFIFQEPVSSLDPLMTVEDQLVEGMRAHGQEPEGGARERALHLLNAVGISEPARRLRQYPFELSGGMCQRVMIAMAIAGDPAVLVADEPTTALDVTIQAQILELMKRMQRERGTAVLLITHDMGVVADMADRVAVMYAGCIVEQAPTEALYAAPHHPYSWLLLRSVPRLDDTPKTRLPVIEGAVPSPQNWAKGCRFAPRCPIASAQCSAQTPPLAPSGPGRLAACWHPERMAAMGKA